MKRAILLLFALSLFGTIRPILGGETPSCLGYAYLARPQRMLKHLTGAGKSFNLDDLLCRYILRIKVPQTGILNLNKPILYYHFSNTLGEQIPAYAFHVKDLNSFLSLLQSAGWVLFGTHRDSIREIREEKIIFDRDAYLKALETGEADPTQFQKKTSVSRFLGMGRDFVILSDKKETIQYIHENIAEIQSIRGDLKIEIRLHAMDVSTRQKISILLSLGLKAFHQNALEKLLEHILQRLDRVKEIILLGLFSENQLIVHTDLFWKEAAPLPVEFASKKISLPAFQGQDAFILCTTLPQNPDLLNPILPGMDAVGRQNLQSLYGPLYHCVEPLLETMTLREKEHSLSVSRLISHDISKTKELLLKLIQDGIKTPVTAVDSVFQFLIQNQMVLIYFDGDIVWLGKGFTDAESLTQFIEALKATAYRNVEGIPEKIHVYGQKIKNGKKLFCFYTISSTEKYSLYLTLELGVLAG